MAAAPVADGAGAGEAEASCDLGGAGEVVGVDAPRRAPEWGTPANQQGVTPDTQSVVATTQTVRFQGT